jgi:hypothetical protein
MQKISIEQCKEGDEIYVRGGVVNMCLNGISLSPETWYPATVLEDAGKGYVRIQLQYGKSRHNVCEPFLVAWGTTVERDATDQGKLVWMVRHDPNVLHSARVRDSGDEVIITWSNERWHQRKVMRETYQGHWSSKDLVEIATCYPGDECFVPGEVLPKGYHDLTYHLCEVEDFGCTYRVKTHRGDRAMVLPGVFVWPVPPVPDVPKTKTEPQNRLTEYARLRRKAEKAYGFDPVSHGIHLAQLQSLEEHMQNKPFTGNFWNTVEEIVGPSDKAVIDRSSSDDSHAVISVDIGFLGALTIHLDYEENTPSPKDDELDVRFKLRVGGATIAREEWTVKVPWFLQWVESVV